MSKILKRDEYINEIYNPMMEKKQEDEKYQELVALNEGILKNLFGKITRYETYLILCLEVFLLDTSCFGNLHQIMTA